MQQPGQLREGERPEFQGMQGPFGGILSEIPPHKTEQFSGFVDAQNVSFRLSQAMVRQSYLPITAMPNPQEPIVGVFDFFNATGNRIQVIVTPTRVLLWNGGSSTWTNLGGGPLTGLTTNIFTAAVVNQKLCFSQGVDKVQLWDGIGGAFAAAAVAAVPARYLAEIANHLVVGYTTEGGNPKTQRIRWTGSGDPTDWTSTNSGVTDLNNDLGPITGLISLYQSGWVFQQWGIVQVRPTGIGTNPFVFPKVVTGRQKGNICPYSLAIFNEQMAPYVGKDNIYVFTGNTSEPIGDYPISGSRVRLGARSRIFADLKAAPLNQVFGFATTSIGGNPFNAYWLFIPNVGAWVFNFDEFNWTKFVFDSNVSTAGVFNTAGSLRIIDLVGAIQDQSWSPTTLGSSNPLDDFLLGFQSGEPGLSSFATRSEMPWSMTTGPMPFQDLRHEKTTARVRIIIKDNAANMAFSVTVSSEKNESQTKAVLIGTGSGAMLEVLVDVPRITGLFATIKVFGDAGQPVDVSEIIPYYTVAGDYKNADNIF